MNSRSLVDITEHIFAAAMAPAAWTPALEAMTDLFDADHAVLVARESTSGEALVAASARLDEANFRRFLSPEAMRLMEPYLWAIPTGTAIRWSQLASDREIELSPFYNEIVRPANGFYAVASRQEGPAFTVFLAICRPRAAGDFAASDSERMQALLPSLATALDLQCRLHATEQRYAGLAGVLDGLDSAVIVTDALARPIFLNREAERIAAEDDGLDADLTRLAASEPEATHRLHEAITYAARETAIEGRRLRLERPSGRSPLLLHILPIARLGTGLSGLSAPRVAIFVKESDTPRAIDRRAIVDAFGLTARESEVAALLAHGTDLPSIATALQMSYSTVRTHLLRVFEKTGVHSQAALVALLWRLEASPSERRLSNA